MARLSWLVLLAGTALFGFLAARHATLEAGPAVAMVSITLIALPSLAASLRWLGRRRALGMLLTLSALGYAIELLGLLTGWPYGAFEYSGGIGPRIADTLPVMLPLSYVPLVLGAVVLVVRSRRRSLVAWIVAGAAWLVAFDLVLDPGAVAMGYWTYGDGGAYYGVPLGNFLGWLLSGAIAMAVCWHWIVGGGRSDVAPPAGLGLSASLLIAYWSGFVVTLGMVIPPVLGTGCVLALLPPRQASDVDNVEGGA